jgi:Spy/CpxP family protein refolding chaperone
MGAVTRRRIRRVLRRLTLDERQAQIVRLLLREDRRQRDLLAAQLVRCRADLHEAIHPEAPDSATVLDLSVRERRLMEQERMLSVFLEGRIAAILGPEQAVELRSLAPVAAGSSEWVPKPQPQPQPLRALAAP